jgi:prolyl oligopeptidase
MNVKPSQAKIWAFRAAPAAMFLALSLGAAVPSSQDIAKPKAKRVHFIEEIHGRRIPDPYRWLEDQRSPETRAWLAEQEKYAAALLSNLPSVKEITAALEPVYATERMSVPEFSAGRFYYTKKLKGAERNAIYSRPTLDGEEKLVLDPAELSSDPTVTVEILAVSPEGEYLAYSHRDGGEDEVTIRIRDLGSGKDLEDLVPRGMHWSFAWNTAGDGFYYSVDDKVRGARVFFHRIGRELKDDPLVYEAERREYWVNVSEIEEGKRLFLSLGIGWQRQEFYIKDLETNGAWHPVIKGIDAQFVPCWVEKKLWMITDFGAPHGRVVEVDLNDPDPEKWKEIIPESQDVLAGLTFLDGRLYLRYSRDAAAVIWICEPDGKFLRELDVPGRGDISLPQGTDKPGVLLFTFQSFTQPLTIFTYDPKTTERKIWYQEPSPGDTSDFVVSQEWYESKDGTRVPIWITHKKGIRLDGSNPTLLNGYGGFNVALLPEFSGFNSVWIQKGGIYALANLRGGSEFGRAWHKSGMLRFKQNVFDDFIGAAEYLTGRRYTSPSKLAIKGASNGGLLMGAALTQRPDLYQVVLAVVPEFDLIGFPRYKHINPPALLEYGDSSKPEEFEFIIGWSPVQKVRPNTAYPAVLVTTGDMDSRVDPVEACKMVANLQWATNSDRPIVFNHDPRIGHSGGRSFSKQLRDAAWEMAFLS